MRAAAILVLSTLAVTAACNDRQNPTAPSATEDAAHGALLYATTDEWSGGGDYQGDGTVQPVDLTGGNTPLEPGTGDANLVRAPRLTGDVEIAPDGEAFPSESYDMSRHKRMAMNAADHPPWPLPPQNLRVRSSTATSAKISFKRPANRQTGALNGEWRTRDYTTNNWRRGSWSLADGANTGSFSITTEPAHQYAIFARVRGGMSGRVNHTAPGEDSGGDQPRAPRIGRIRRDGNWTCSEGQRCQSDYMVLVRGAQNGYKVQMEVEGDDSDVYTTSIGGRDFPQPVPWKVGQTLYVRARQRANDSSPWSAWSDRKRHRPMPTEAEARSLPRPESLRSMEIGPYAGGWPVTFEVPPWDGGLPILYYEWGDSTMRDSTQGGRCNDSRFPYRRIYVRNNNRTQTFTAYVGANVEAIAIRAVSLAGEGDCTTTATP